MRSVGAQTPQAVPWAVSHRSPCLLLPALCDPRPLPPASYTFQQVQEHTDQIWKFQRHDLIEEYHGRPPAPPPFILLSHLHLFIKRVVLKIPAKRHKQLSKPALHAPSVLSAVSGYGRGEHGCSF